MPTDNETDSVGSVGRNSRRLLCHNCGGVYKDVWDPQVSGTQCPHCPFCGAGWFSNTLENYHPPLKHQYRRFLVQEELFDLQIEEMCGILLDDVPLEREEEVEVWTE